MLIDFKGASDVLIKLLNMVEKSIGWVISPKGTKKDFNEGLETYKKSIEDDQSLSGIEKGAYISTAKRDLLHYINTGKIIGFAGNNINTDADFENVGVDWLAFFFEHAKNISREDVQLIWGKILANKINGDRQITKKMVHILSIIEDEDIDVFCKICSMTFEHTGRERSKYPFTYIVEFPTYYNSHGIRRYHLYSLANLGLIEYDKIKGFVLPTEVPILKYGKTMIKLSSDERISIGNIRLTNEGRILYDMTDRMYQDDFIGECKRMWKTLNIKYETA